MIQIGLERLLHNEGPDLAGQRIGYLSNQASTTAKLRHGRLALQEKYGDRLTCLFSPQHGFFSEKQDNMIESADSLDPVTGLPIFSLYGEHRRPTAQMFADLDVLLIDLIDVGTRVYTFMYTMAYCLEAAVEFGKRIIVLDRPNPLGGERVEGNLLRPECRSFVGLYPLPMRHGLTLGELALYWNRTAAIGADLEVVAMSGWQRAMLFADSGFPWLPPSPNMPTPATAMVYPGQVLWEGSNISEGRGTTLPFEFVGAPFWEHGVMLERLRKTPLPGCFLRPIIFEPTSGKWAGAQCHGFQIHVTDPELFLPYRTGLALLQATMLEYPGQFCYKEPPYEYEFHRLPMDLLLGDRALRLGLEQGVAVVDLEEGWQEELQTYDQGRRRFYLY
jgi:uncharacterized protein YbbC (DUF1343 family)